MISEGELKGGTMQAFSIEESIVKGNLQVNELFEFVQDWNYALPNLNRNEGELSYLVN